MLAISTIVFTGCSGSNNTATISAADCTALEAAGETAGENFSTMMIGIMYGSAEYDEGVCTSLTSAIQAFLDGGCTACEDTDEACLDDGSNEDTCCDEPTQEGVDAMTVMCATYE